MIPSPAELTYFYEVANELNLSRASSKLGMSQPSLSLAVKRLEQTIGASLFVRHKQGVTLTQAGRKLLVQVKPLLQHWDNTRLQAIQSHEEIQGEVTIGCHTTIGLFLHEFMAKLLKQHNKLTFNLKMDVSPKTTEHVIASSIDIGIVASPIKHPDLIIRKIDSSESTFWKTQGDHPTQDIHSDKLVVVCDPNIPQTQLLLRKWKHDKLKSARLLKVNSLEVVASLTANGCGIGILPACFIQTIYQDRLQRIAGAPVCSDSLFLIYRKENRDVKAVSAVINAIKEVI